MHVLYTPSQFGRYALATVPTSSLWNVAIYILLLLIFIGLKEIAVAMSDPFGDETAHTQCRCTCDRRCILCLSLSSHCVACVQTVGGGGAQVMTRLTSISRRCSRRRTRRACPSYATAASPAGVTSPGSTATPSRMAYQTTTSARRRPHAASRRGRDQGSPRPM